MYLSQIQTRLWYIEGIANQSQGWFVRHIEGSLCPYCRAYERVYGRKAHEPVPEEAE